MKMVKMHGHGKISIIEAPDPKPDDQSVILRVKASAICGSELYTLRQDHEPTECINSGHELVGIIEHAPAGSGFKVGQKAGACIVQGCGKCEFCAAGDETGCLSKRYDSGNGHSEMFKLGVRGVRLLPDGVDWPAGALLTGDGLGVPVRTATRLGDTRGKTIVIFGLGPVGMSNTLVQSFLGARVMGVDLSDYRIDYAKKIGAEKTVNSKTQDVAAAVKEWTGGKGADIVMIAAPVTALFDQASELVRRHGIICQVAEMDSATINPSKIMLRREATMMGSWYYTSADWKRMVEMHKAGLPYPKLITHVLPMDRAQEAFDTFSAGKSGKVVITYNSEN